MNMLRNTGIWTGTAALIAIGTAALTAVYCMPENLLPDMPGGAAVQEPQHVQAAQDPDALCSAAEQAAGQQYLIRLNGDMLCVYAEGSKTPAAEYELPADWLPDYDRILLEYGIRTGNADELRRILEDYIS